MSTALLDRQSRLLVQRLRLWTPARYAAAAPPWGCRADLVRHLAQVLADAAADAEGAPRRPLPRLESDLAVADQLAVTSADAVTALSGSAAAVAGPVPQRHDLASALTCHVLAHRFDLLGEPVPAGLAAPLGQAGADAVLHAGRASCRAAG